jgi:hypothetical protein
MIRATVTWMIRDSLVAYMSREPDFTAETSGGATFSVSQGARIPVEASEDFQEIRALGSVVLTAHGGELVVPLARLRIHNESLWVDDPFEVGEAESPNRLHLVDLRPIPTETSEGAVRRYGTYLSRDAELLFLRYSAGSAFADLVLMVDGS